METSEHLRLNKANGDEDWFKRYHEFYGDQIASLYNKGSTSSEAAKPTSTTTIAAKPKSTTTIAAKPTSTTTKHVKDWRSEDWDQFLIDLDNHQYKKNQTKKDKF
jgi:hypothetical protein